VILDLLVPLAPLVILALLVLSVLLEQQVQWVLQERRDRKVQQDLPEQQVLWAQQEPPVLQERLEPQDQ
jgi:hypothetical protein